MTATPVPPHPPTTYGGRLGRTHGRGAVRSRAVGTVPALVGRTLGLVPGRTVTAGLDIEPSPAGDRWIRRFGRRTWSTRCERTALGLIEWIGPRRGMVGLDLAVDLAGDRATLHLRGLWLGSWWLGRIPGLRVDVVIEQRGAGLWFAPVVSLAGRVLVAYEGSIR